MRWHAYLGALVLTGILASVLVVWNRNGPEVKQQATQPAMPRPPARSPTPGVVKSSPAAPVYRETYDDLDGSGGSWTVPVKKLDTAFATRIYLEDGKRYEIYAAGQQWHRPMWRSATIYPYPGASPSLAFETCRARRETDDCPALPATHFSNAKDREELAIINHETGETRHLLKFGRTRYFSFLVYFHEGTEVPMLWTLISQVWQVNDENGPPFAVWLKPSRAVPPGQTPATAPIALRFAARDDSTTTGLTSICDDGDNSAGCPAILYSKDVVRGRWYRFTMQLTPSYSGDGKIAIWDGGAASTTKPAVVWNHDWGYTTGAKSEVSAADKFDVRVGIYRRQQPRALKVMFDDIRFGPTAASVDPLKHD